MKGTHWNLISYSCRLLHRLRRLLLRRTCAFALHFVGVVGVVASAVAGAVVAAAAVGAVAVVETSSRSSEHNEKTRELLTSDKEAPGSWMSK